MIAGGVDVTRDCDDAQPPFSLGGDSFSEKYWGSGAVAGGICELGKPSSSSLLDLLRCTLPLMGIAAECDMLVCISMHANAVFLGIFQQLQVYALAVRT